MNVFIRNELEIQVGIYNKEIRTLIEERKKLKSKLAVSF